MLSDDDQTIVYILLSICSLRVWTSTSVPEPVRVPRSLPRGRSHLAREVVLLSQRARLTEAATGQVGTNGYAATSVGDIIGAAGVSRSTFYEQFKDKQACFIAAYEEGARVQLDQVRAACEQARPAVARLQFGVRAFLEALDRDPMYARVSMVEVLAAGHEAVASRDAVHGEYAALLRTWHADVRAENELVPAMPDEIFDCAVGGVADLLGQTVRGDEVERLATMAPVIVTFLLNLAAVPAGRDLAAALSASRARRT